MCVVLYVAFKQLLLSFVHLAFFKVSESCHFELEDLPSELPAQLWDT